MSLQRIVHLSECTTSCRGRIARLTRTPSSFASPLDSGQLRLLVCASRSFRVLIIGLDHSPILLTSCHGGTKRVQTNAGPRRRPRLNSCSCYRYHGFACSVCGRWRISRPRTCSRCVVQAKNVRDPIDGTDDFHSTSQSHSPFLLANGPVRRSG